MFASLKKRVASKYNAFNYGYFNRLTPIFSIIRQKIGEAGVGHNETGPINKSQN